MDVSSTIQNMLTASKDLIDKKLGAREQLVKSASSLIASLETPSETIFRIAFAEPARFAALRIAIDLKIFDSLSAAKGSPVSVVDLARVGGADPTFIHRILRHLAAMNIIGESSTGQFYSTSFSEALVESKYYNGVIYTYDCLGPALHGLAQYIKKTGYQNPSNPLDGPFQFAHKTNDAFFVWLSKQEIYMTAFNDYMGVERLFRLAPDAKEDAVAIVDVGGGMGHDLVELKAKYPAIAGRLVLQDLPPVIQQIQDLPSAIEKVEHDFFTPQPVKGAKVYYLHSVLHDWDDESCIKILGHLKTAMQSDYSKILINDFVIPDKGATWAATAMDIGMMTLGSVKERTESDWRTLFGKAGLSVEKITPICEGSESIIELKLPA